MIEDVEDADLKAYNAAKLHHFVKKIPFLKGAPEVADVMQKMVEVEKALLGGPGGLLFWRSSGDHPGVGEGLHRPPQTLGGLP